MNKFLAFLLLIATAVSAQLPKIVVSENHRFLQTEDGKPFFWTGDTAWELIHRLNDEELDQYFEMRESQGFNITQTVVLAELDGIETPNAFGEKPFRNLEKLKINPAYIKHVRKVLDKAEKHNMYVALLPTWGDKLYKDSWGLGPEIFNVETAFEYGKTLGLNLRDKTNIVWVLGGDRKPRENSNDVAVWQSMAKGIQEGLGVFGSGIFTFHPQPSSPGGSSNWFHKDEWLSFNMHQTGHWPDAKSYLKIQHDYNLQPTKPTFDGEPIYEHMAYKFDYEKFGYSTASDLRKIMYWNVFAGAFGQTYGCNEVWQMYDNDKKGNLRPINRWQDGLDLPMANQMKHLKHLMLSRPFFDRIPDQGLIESEQSDSLAYVIGTRDEAGTYAFIYFPTGKTTNINTKNLRGQKLNVSWFDPRTGAAFNVGQMVNYGSFAATPPSSGKGNDWVLVIDDARNGYDKAGTVAY